MDQDCFLQASESNHIRAVIQAWAKISESLTHWDLNKMDNIMQIPRSNAF